jgi:hypothetical protein
MINRGLAREGGLVGRVWAFFGRALKYAVDEPSKVEELHWDAEDHLESSPVDPPETDPWEADVTDDTAADNELSLYRPLGSCQEDETEQINPEPELGTAGEWIASNGSAHNVASRDGAGSSIAGETRAGTGIDADDVGDAEFDETIEVVDVALQDEEASLVASTADEYFDYDPDAHQAPWTEPKPSDEKSLRRAREKAASIASILEVTSRREQEDLFDWLTELFSRQKHPTTFQAIKGIALQGITADLLHRVVALRDCWMERREWWPGRYERSREVRPLRRNSGELTWAVALRVCRTRADYAPEDMIDEDWFDEWLNLAPEIPSDARDIPGYYRFAAYVDAKVSGREPELLNYGLRRFDQSDGREEMGEDRGWWRTLPRYEEDIRFGFNVLTPFRDGFGAPGYPEYQEPFRGAQSES